MKRENKFRTVYVQCMECKNKFREFHLKGMQRENKFREFRYFSSLQPRKYLPAKISSLKVLLKIAQSSFVDIWCVVTRHGTLRNGRLCKFLSIHVKKSQKYLFDYRLVEIS